MESETEATMRVGGRRGRTEKKREVMRGRRIVPRINGDGEERKRDDRAFEQPPLF